jgi:hypothetical protein
MQCASLYLNGGIGRGGDAAPFPLQRRWPEASSVLAQGRPVAVVGEALPLSIGGRSLSGLGWCNALIIRWK